MNRRKILKSTILGAGIFSAVKTMGLECNLPTPAQTEGPFYPISDQADKDWDLVNKIGSKQDAVGDVVFLEGVVKDINCRPIKGALVEIWQACESGRYNHPSDPNRAKLDPNFQYWGRAVSDKDGKYRFRTIIPGDYQATPSWIRPPHIHFKVSLRGFEELTSQIYFKGNSLNSKDRVLMSLPKEERERLIVDFKTRNQKRVGNFDITLNSVS